MRSVGALSARGAWLLLSASTALGCGRKTRHEDDTPSAAAATPDRPSKDELTRFVEWRRDWILLSNRHKAELNAESARFSGNPALMTPGAIERDPQLLALVARQRDEMGELIKRAPAGPSMQALDATLAGVGRLVVEEQGMAFIPGRNEAALAAARARYGDRFVEWVLSQEPYVVGVLAPAR